MSKSLRIATRQSPLALWQAHHVAGLLRAVDPQLEVSLLEMTTEGDRFLQAPLSQVGGKGLFVKEIEAALLDGRADVAVHSLKDMTSLMPEGLLIAAMPEREDPRDAWVSPANLPLDAAPQGARIGTSSLRRTCLLRERRPDLDVVSLRGNVQTRLRRTWEEGFTGTVLATAGLKRLALDDKITEVLPPERSLPAVGQGVLALQSRVADERVRALLAHLEHPATRHAVTAERAFLSRLEGGCSVPLAGYAILEGDQLFLRGLVGRPDGAQVLRAEARGAIHDAERLGLSVAEALLAQGADRILREVRPKS